MNITSTIKSYVYTQYADDPDISAFFASYNALSQGNLDAINGYQLPIYPNQTGALLDWAASSIYGVFRPSLSSGGPRPVGSINTFEFNTEEFNGFDFVNSSTNYIVDDSTYQRIIQWNTFKGDGFQFSIRWLKRRIERFLHGAIFPDQTYDVSITFAGENQVVIAILSANYRLIGGAFYAGALFGGADQSFNGAITMEQPHVPSELIQAFAAAINSGVLILPFQYKFTVQV